VEGGYQLGVGIGIHVHEPETPAVFALELLEHRPQLLARRAPGRPEVHDDRDFERSLYHIPFERRQRGVDHRKDPLSPSNRAGSCAGRSGSDTVIRVRLRGPKRRTLPTYPRYSVPMAFVT